MFKALYAADFIVNWLSYSGAGVSVNAFCDRAIPYIL